MQGRCVEPNTYHCHVSFLVLVKLTLLSPASGISSGHQDAEVENQSGYIQTPKTTRPFSVAMDTLGLFGQNGGVRFRTHGCVESHQIRHLGGAQKGGYAFGGEPITQAIPMLVRHP